MRMMPNDSRKGSLYSITCTLNSGGGNEGTRDSYVHLASYGVLGGAETNDRLRLRTWRSTERDCRRLFQQNGCRAPSAIPRDRARDIAAGKLECSNRQRARG